MKSVYEKLLCKYQTPLKYYLSYKVHMSLVHSSLFFPRDYRVVFPMQFNNLHELDMCILIIVLDNIL